jgi:hypothetical protein
MSRHGRAQAGQGALEFIVVFLGFAALFLGLFEMTRVYRAKHVLNSATFLAARTGALLNARTAPMNAELANGMVLLFMASGRSAQHLARARADTQALVSLPGLGIQILSPTRQAFDQLQRRQWIRRSDESEHRWQDVIPNDNLRLRPRALAQIDTARGRAPLNLQDANLLRVRSLWCHRLVTPVLDRVVYEIVNLAPFLSARQSVCSAISGGAGAGIARGFYLAVSADATVRMQSPIVVDDMPAS